MFHKILNHTGGRVLDERILLLLLSEGTSTPLISLIVVFCHHINAFTVITGHLIRSQWDSLSLSLRHPAVAI